MAIDDQIFALDDEKLKELEIERTKRRRVGRLRNFWRRFIKHKVGLVGLAVIVFVFILGVTAPFIAGEGLLIPYDPKKADLPSQYLPPLSYEPEELSGAFPISNKGTAPAVRKIAGIIGQENVTFIKGVGSTVYKQISQIDSINRSETEIWANKTNAGTFNATSGQIILTDTTFNGSAFVDYRVGGKMAFKFQAAAHRIITFRMKLKVETDSQETSWRGDIQLHVHEEDELGTDVEPLASSIPLDGKEIVKGVYTHPRDYYFTFSSLKVTMNNQYWVVVDCDIENVDSWGVTQLLTMSADIPDSRSDEDAYTRGWNAETGWNSGIQVDSGDGTLLDPGDGLTPYFVTFRPTNKFHILGTDALGRDILSATIWGARTSMTVAFIAISVEMTIGVFLGAVSGYYGGKIDNIIMRITDIFLTIPVLFLLLIAVTIWEKISLFFIAITIGLFGWSGTARIIRAEFLSLREMEYTDAARALGVSNRGIIFRHLLPNAMAPVIVIATLGVADAILIEAGLSFLGFGDPLAISWGTAIEWGMQGATLRFAPWVATIPGLAIFLAVISYNLVGDALRDALDPRLK